MRRIRQPSPISSILNHAGLFRIRIREGKGASLNGGRLALRGRSTNLIASRPPCLLGAAAAVSSLLVTLAPARPCEAQDRRGTVVHPSPVRTVDTPPAWPIDCYLPVSAEAESVPAGVERLLLQFARRYTAGHYVEAEVLARQLVEHAPTRPEAHYNHACALASLYRIDEALDALDQAITLGWRKAIHLTIDGDLDPIRRHERFDQLVARMNRLAAEECIVSEPLRTDALEAIVADLDLHVPTLLQRYQTPGASIALVREGRVVWAGAYGANHATTGSALTPEHLFSLRQPTELLAMLGVLGGMDRATLAWAIDLHRPAPRRAQGNGARLTTFEHQASFGGGDEQSDDGRGGFFRQVLENAEARGFAGYCQGELLPALAMESSRFVVKDPDWSRVAVGHTPLGTPTPLLRNPRHGNRLFTTAADLGRLMRELIAVERASSTLGIDGPLFSQLASDDATILGRLIPSLRIDETPSGSRVRVVDIPPDRALARARGESDAQFAGVGCLMQWYPAAGCGVVVMFNSEAGLPAAERIAHLALGGD